MTDNEMIKMLEEEGYTHIRKMPDGEYTGIFTYLFTSAIIHGMTSTGYENRWCYHALNDAIKALDAWNGEGEPEGWHRHPPSGRRRDADGNEHINF